MIPQMLFLGIDLGSSSIKLSVFDSEKGTTIGAISVPDFEMPIVAPKFGWAEQDPESWWQFVKTESNNWAQNLLLI